MGARRHGQEGEALASPWKCKVFLWISTCSYSNMFSRRIIYALFLQPVIRFWGLGPQTPPGLGPQTLPGLHPWTPLGNFCPQIPNLPTPGQNPVDAHVWKVITMSTGHDYSDRHVFRHNVLDRMLSYRRETVLQDADWNWETIFYRHYRSIFNHCDTISLKICQIPLKKREMRAITAFRVIMVGTNRKPVCYISD